MARMIQGVVQKHKLMEQSLVVINKSGGSGGEGFLAIKDSAGNPHKIIITLSSLFTTPLATGIPFSLDEATPVAMLALDSSDERRVGIECVSTCRYRWVPSQ